jgi:hypothetical protein
MSVFMLEATRQPTIRRENASTMKHTYAIPDLVGNGLGQGHANALVAHVRAEARR